MIISDKLASAFNNQVTAELEASTIYRQLAYLLDDMSLTGMRDWMRAHSQEEIEHAEAFATHLLDRGVTPQIGEIPAPKLQITTALEAFEAALAHEEKVSALIRNLASLAAEENDFDSRPLLDTFLAEQIEEESSVGDIVNRLRLVGNDGSGILRIDAELGEKA